MNLEFIKDGEIGLITTDNGRIVQLAVTKEMYKTLMIIISTLSKENKLVKMGEEHDLVLKSTVKSFKRAVS